MGKKKEKTFHRATLDNRNLTIKARLVDKEVPLTEEAFQVIRTAVVGPICVLQVPEGPLMTRQEVFDL